MGAGAASGSGPSVTLVVFEQGLSQVQNRRRPKPHEDRRLTLAGEVQSQRDQDGDERTAHVESLATVHYLPPTRCGLSLGVYPAADGANRDAVASDTTWGPNFGECTFHAL